MKKLVVLFAVLLLAAFILLPGAGNGKYNVSKPLVADGWPLPPPVPPGPGAVTLVADGWPLPPGPPVDTLIADGWPLPPPVPPGPGSNTLVADGWPLPPPVPPGGGNVIVNLV